MELWENEVYRFKTIGQLKVSLSGFNSSKNYVTANITVNKVMLVRRYSSPFIAGF